jgi:DNA-binding XRE family transcriptional regulator
METRIGNSLRIHRRKAGLSQRELGQIVGYRRSWQISRHERSKTAPPLLIALSYEVIFGVAISAIFAGMQATVSHGVEQRLADFEKLLKEGNGTNETTRKLQWLKERRTSG